MPPRPKKHTKPPTAETMESVQSDELWQTYAELIQKDTLSQKLRERSDFYIDDLLIVPGVSVKSVFETSGWKHFGITIRIEKNEVIVISTQGPKTIWSGSIEQYYEMWCVD